jgi:ubiquinone/menaquinone biosynthesis C-methylase UbiE
MYRENRQYSSLPEAWEGGFKGMRVGGDVFSHLGISLDERWRQIARRLASGSRVLDAGCGMGAWCAFLTQKGFQTVGLDFSATMIDLLKQRFPQQDWMPGLVQNIPLPSESVDAVISWGVIEHDETGPSQAWGEFYRVMRGGGYAFITVPIDTFHMRQISRIQFEQPGADTFFQYFFTPAELEEQAMQAGFEVECITSCSRTYAPAFPHFYKRVENYPLIVRRMVHWAMKPVVALRQDATNMILAVVRKKAV